MVKSSYFSLYIECIDDYDDESQIIKAIDRKIKNSLIDFELGDVLQFSEYRDTYTYFYGKDGKLVRNPDNSQSGYLSIPFEITQYFDDAFSKYPDTSLYIDIALRYDDKKLKNDIGDLDSRFNYIYFIEENLLFVEYPNGKTKTFDYNTVTPILINSIM